jgi:hypothetical protein
MKSTIATLLAVVFAAVGVLLPIDRADAHHSAAVFFNRDRIVEIHGVITQWSFTNPHPILMVEVTDPDGQKVQWLMQFTNVLNMKRLGITTETFAAGMEVTVSGPRANAEEILALNPELVVLVDGTEVRAAPGQAGERGVTRPN